MVALLQRLDSASDSTLSVAKERDLGAVSFRLLNKFDLYYNLIIIFYLCIFARMPDPSQQIRHPALC